jgi:hypothetical protein
MTEDRDFPTDLDPFTAEQLLSGEPVDREVGPLADLLAAAAAPARADELAGEAAAVAAFRDGVGASRPATSALRSTVTKALAIKVAVALTAVAGASLGAAAAAGKLPGGEPQAAPPPSTARPTARSTAMTPVKPSSDPADRSTKPRPSLAPSKPRPTKRVTPTAPPPHPEFEGLCRAYLWARTMVERYGEDGERPGDDHDYDGPDGSDRRQPPPPPEPGDQRRPDPKDPKAAERMLDHKAYRELVRVAGGKAKVAAYCTTLLKSSNSRGSRAPESIAPPSRRSVHPSGRPTHGPTYSRPAASQTGSLTASPPPRGR